MINYKLHTLSNGLKVVIHTSPECENAALNIMYYVGSRDESSDKTGLAHLFEHLMFGGSLNIQSYDSEIQSVGGNSNAYTTTDVTSYYCIMPAPNIETAFWLESDRMLGLSLSQESVYIQKKVVIEEFKERYLNRPYGDAWFKIRELAYNTHPYRWPTIGKEISHIENVTLQDIENFFEKHYFPGNAVLVISGGIHDEDALDLSEKWFGSIPYKPKIARDIPQEPQQYLERVATIRGEVPYDAIYKTYHIPGLMSQDYYAVESLAAILGDGNSSRLYSKLVDQKKIFSSISVHTTESIDPGLLVISGMISPEFTIQHAEDAINETVHNLFTNLATCPELQKVKNNYLASFAFSSLDLMNRSDDLAMSTILGNTNLVNQTLDQIEKVDTSSVNRVAKTILQSENCSTIYYKKDI